MEIKPPLDEIGAAHFKNVGGTYRVCFWALLARCKSSAKAWCRVIVEVRVNEWMNASTNKSFFVVRFLKTVRIRPAVGR
jgi:hypothetical protein